jgi:hypothetical protein
MGYNHCLPTLVVSIKFTLVVVYLDPVKAVGLETTLSSDVSSEEIGGIRHRVTFTLNQ